MGTADIDRRVAVQAALCGLAAVATAASAKAVGERMRIVTEELPPYNMTYKGQATGLSTAVLAAVLGRLGVSVPIESMPWPRAYETALQDRNVLIYSIDHTPQRDALFKWVGEISPPERSFLYARPERHLVLARLADARGLRIAVGAGNTHEQYLRSQGFEPGVNLVRTNKIEAGYELLRLGRVDLWASGEVSAPYYARGAGDDPQRTLAVTLPLSDSGVQRGLEMAFGPNSDDALVQRFRTALDAIRKSGELHAIHQRWVQVGTG